MREDSVHVLLLEHSGTFVRMPCLSLAKKDCIIRLRRNICQALFSFFLFFFIPNRIAANAAMPAAKVTIARCV